jgi:hypothetical protein
MKAGRTRGRSRSPQFRDLLLTGWGSAFAAGPAAFLAVTAIALAVALLVRTTADGDWATLFNEISLGQLTRLFLLTAHGIGMTVSSVELDLSASFRAAVSGGLLLMSLPVWFSARRSVRRTGAEGVPACLSQGLKVGAIYALIGIGTGLAFRLGVPLLSVSASRIDTVVAFSALGLAAGAAGAMSGVARKPEPWTITLRAAWIGLRLGLLVILVPAIGLLIRTALRSGDLAGFAEGGWSQAVAWGLLGLILMPGLTAGLLAFAHGVPFRMGATAVGLADPAPWASLVVLVPLGAVLLAGYRSASPARPADERRRLGIIGGGAYAALVTGGALSTSVVASGRIAVGGRVFEGSWAAGFLMPTAVAVLLLWGLLGGYLGAHLRVRRDSAPRRGHRSSRRARRHPDAPDYDLRCPRCGRTASASDRYCSGCGTGLEPPIP